MPNEVTGDLDKKLEAMANSLTRKRRVAINKAGMQTFREAFEGNFKRTMNGHGDHILNTLTEDTTPGGAVGLGFSKKGKVAYLARFQNDGWIPRNQYGGPYKYHGTYPMVPGKHFWEDTIADQKVEKATAEREVQEAQKYIDRAARGGGLS